jgi:hypothetical protein
MCTVWYDGQEGRREGRTGVRATQVSLYHFGARCSIVTALAFPLLPSLAFLSNLISTIRTPSTIYIPPSLPPSLHTNATPHNKRGVMFEGTKM